MTKPMKIASWNVNSIKAREDHVAKFLEDSGVDILMMQELKGESFPEARFKDMGYHAIVNGQKAYNGVAILSKNELSNPVTKLAGDEGDEQARFIQCECNDFALINIYLPNGNPVDTEKFDYKLAWMDRLYAVLKKLRESNKPFIIGGDFNVIPEDSDCYDPKAWEGDALFRIETRKKFRTFENLGLYDAFRLFEKGANNYTFWDYQAGAWPQNKGIRIDHFLLSPEMVDRVKSCVIDPTPRGWERPSDHTPIIVEINE